MNIKELRKIRDDIKSEFNEFNLKEWDGDGTFYGNFLTLFSYEHNIGNLKIHFTVELTKEGIINKNISFEWQIINELNSIIKDFSDIRAEIIDAEDYGGIFVTSEYPDMTIQTQDELKSYIKRCEQLVERLNKIFNMGK
jgi:hypothetical protein